MSNRRLRWLWPTQASMDETYGTASLRVPEGVWTALALPLCQIANALAYARTYQGWVRRIFVFMRFVPTIAVSAAIWAACWYVVVHLVVMVVRGAI